LSDDLTAEICEIAANVLDVPPAAVREAGDLEQVENWDSLHQLNLMLALEETYGIQLSPDDLGLLTHVDTIRELVEKQRAGG
jgi:acyl carrier protein